MHIGCGFDRNFVKFKDKRVETVKKVARYEGKSPNL